MIKTKISYAALSGVLLFLCFPPFNFAFLAFIALVPLIIALEDAEYKVVILISLVFCTIFTTGLLYWIHIYHFIALPGIIIIFNIFFLIALLIYSFIAKRLFYIDIYVFPVVWTSIEFLRSQGSFGFPWGLIGYTQFEFLQFIQIADIVGVFGISFFICLVNSLIAFLILTHFKINRLIIQGVIVILIFFLTLLYGFDRIDNFREIQTSKKIKIGIIQPNFSPYFFNWSDNKEEVIAYLNKAISNLSLENLDLIILSETIILETLFNYNPSNNNFDWHPSAYFWKFLFSNSTLKTNTNFLVGIPTIKYANDGTVNYFNSAILLNNAGEIKGYYDKIQLVPFGEFFPFYDNFEFIKKIADSFECGNFKSGLSANILKTSDFSIAPLICYESIFHDLTRRFAKSNPDFFVNITNDAWTKNADAHFQHYSMNVFSSIQNKIPLVRCGNSGISGWINEIGESKELSLPLTSTFYSFTISVYSDFKGTFYARYGDIFAEIIIIFAGILIFVSFFFQKKTPSFYY